MTPSYNFITDEARELHLEDLTRRARNCPRCQEAGEEFCLCGLVDDDAKTKESVA